MLSDGQQDAIDAFATDSLAVACQASAARLGRESAYVDSDDRAGRGALVSVYQHVKGGMRAHAVGPTSVADEVHQDIDTYSSRIYI